VYVSLNVWRTSWPDFGFSAAEQRLGGIDQIDDDIRDILGIGRNTP
jgi:hypothetical protein